MSSLEEMSDGKNTFLNHPKTLLTPLSAHLRHSHHPPPREQRDPLHKGIKQLQEICHSIMST